MKVCLDTNVLVSRFAMRWLCDLLDVADEVSGIKITDPRGFWNLAKKRLKK